jgi:chromosome partitioning protein
MIDGRTVMEVEPEGRSAQEVVALWHYIADRLEKNFRRTVFAAPSAVAQAPGLNRPQGGGGGFGRRVAQ